MMEKDTEVKWGNSLGYVLLPFTIGLRDDPLDYIRKAKAKVDRKKHSLEVLYTYFIAEVVMKLFGNKFASKVSDRINAHTTIAFSNLVGPLEEIGFYGHPLAFLAPSSYGQPHVSPNLYFCINANPGWFKDGCGSGRTSSYYMCFCPRWIRPTPKHTYFVFGRVVPKHISLNLACIFTLF